ncbi:hypothetical protein ACHAPC_006475 [Botrytis cinerea]
MSDLTTVYSKDAAFRKPLLIHVDVEYIEHLPPLHVNSNNPLAAGPYSQAIKTSSTIYCSGRKPTPYFQLYSVEPNILFHRKHSIDPSPTEIPCTPEGEILTLETSSISAMTELCIKNLSAVLKEAGSSIEKVVKVNVFLTTMDNFAEMNGAYEKLFKHKPARSCVAVYQLPKGVPVEIECIALA